MFSIATFCVTFLIWIILSGKFDLFHLILGGISSLIVSLTAADLLFVERQQKLKSRLIEGLHVIPYCVWLLYQIVVANFHVVMLALSSRRMERDLDPYVFTFTTHLKTEFAKFILANSITLTPGTVTIRIDHDIFYVHAISRQAAGDLIESESVSNMEKRIALVFEGRRI